MNYHVKSLEGENYLTLPCKSRSSLVTLNKEVINPPPKWNNNNSKSFLATHINHISSTQNQFIWVNDSTSLIHSNQKNHGIQLQLSRNRAGPVQQWAGEAYGFWLQTNEEWPHSWLLKNMRIPGGQLHGLESYPCSNMLNTVETHLQLNCMRHVPGLHHLTTRYKFSFWALIYNLINK